MALDDCGVIIILAPDRRTIERSVVRLILQHAGYQVRKPKRSVVLRTQLSAAAVAIPRTARNSANESMRGDHRSRDGTTETLAKRPVEPVTGSICRECLDQIVILTKDICCAFSHHGPTTTTKRARSCHSRRIVRTLATHAIQDRQIRRHPAW